MSNEAKIDLESILQEILTLGKTVGALDKEKIQQFLTKEINGDTLKEYLVISATLGKDRSGLLVYILTSAKIIKIEIDKEEVQSYSTYLKEVIGVNRTTSLLHSIATESSNDAKVVVEFPQGSFGLRYPASSTKIDSFFQKVDQAIRELKVTP